MFIFRLSFCVCVCVCTKSWNLKIQKKMNAIRVKTTTLVCKFEKVCSSPLMSNIVMMKKLGTYFEANKFLVKLFSIGSYFINHD